MFLSNIDTTARSLYVIIVAILALILSQLIKFALSSLNSNKIRKDVLLSFGGFPSSHTAFITALSVSILVLQLHEGKLDYTFSLALGLGALVVYDSLGLRYIRKDHDKILDEISSAGDFRENDLMKFHFGIRKKRDYTRNIYYRGIMAGVILGIIVSLLCCLIII